MRTVGLLLLALFAAIPAAADSTDRSESLLWAMNSGDVTHYSVKIRVVGKRKLPGEAQPTPIDTTLNLATAVSVGDKAKDGSFPLFISCDSATATVENKTFDMQTDSYPKTTVLVDRNGNIARLIPLDPVRSKQPGINYRSFVLLLNPNAPSVWLRPGIVWQKRIAIPSETHKYDFTYKLEAFEKMLGVDTARVRIDIALADATDTGSTGKGFAVNNYALDGGRLLASHSEMNIKMTDSAANTPSAESVGDLEALVKVDIARIGVPDKVKP